MLNTQRSNTIGFFGSQCRSMLNGLRGKSVMIGSLALIAVLTAPNTSCAEEAAIDDGWRRTKNGWENIATWRVSRAEMTLPSNEPIAPAIISAAADRWLLWHPAAVAAGLLAMSGAGLMAFGIDSRRTAAV